MRTVHHGRFLILWTFEYFDHTGSEISHLQDRTPSLARAKIRRRPGRPATVCDDCFISILCRRVRLHGPLDSPFIPQPLLDSNRSSSLTIRGSLLLEDLIERNPIDAGRFHGHRSHTARHEPIRQLVEIFGEGWKHPHRMLVAPRWNRYEHFSCTDIDTGCVGLSDRPVSSTHSLLSPPAVGLRPARLRAYLLLLRWLLVLAHPGFPSELQATARLCMKR